MIWKPVHKPKFAKFYEVSDSGEVRRIPGYDKLGRWNNGRVLRQATVKRYKMVLMWADAEKWFARVHHLVAHAFIGEPAGEVSVTGWQVNHKNGNKADNRLSNLEWLTSSENHAHATRSGLKSKGTKHYRAIFTEKDVIKIRKLHRDGTRLVDLQKMFGASKGAIAAVVHNRTWKNVTP